MVRKNKKEIAEKYSKAFFLLQENKIFESELLYKQILKLDNKHDSTYHMLGFIKSLTGNYKKAIVLLEKAISLYKCSSEYYNTLAGVYKELNQHEKCFECLKQSLSINPNCSETYNNLAMLCVDMKKYKKAIEFYEKAISLDENAAFIHFNYSLLLLMLGDFEKGWQEYEWRNKLNKNNQIPILPSIKDIYGKNIALIHEQGLGDTIHFIRYAEMIKRSGAKTINAIVPAPLERLISSCPWISSVNKDMNCDFNIPIMSLPFIFRKESIPCNIPYFGFQYKKRDKIRNIGIIHSSIKTDVPSCSINDVDSNKFRMLPSLQSLAFKSAQKRNLDIKCFEKLSEKFSLWNLQPSYLDCGFIKNTEIKDFYDVAELMMKMDLVISIDSAGSHLAGSLGIPTFLLLPFQSEWRWMIDKNDSIWYPTIKIFKQKEPNNWDSTLEDIFNLF